MDKHAAEEFTRAVMDADRFVHLNVERCEEVEAAFKSGKEIPAPTNGWDENEIFQLAGMCLSQITFSNLPIDHAALAHAYALAFVSRGIRNQSEKPR